VSEKKKVDKFMYRMKMFRWFAYMAGNSGYFELRKPVKIASLVGLVVC